MLSIIISSYQPDYFTALEKNIAETCGVPYEIIKVDNQGIMGICEAYNRGADKAKFDYLLFLHEDVLFETQNWGEILVDYLQNSKIGCVGIAGSDYIPNCPFAWWDSPNHQFRNYNQYKKKKLLREYKQTEDKSVICIDGVLIACRTDVYNSVKFDENLKGFHMYDMCFSSNVAKFYKNIITSKIVLNHYSEGTVDLNWFYNIIKYRENLSVPDSLKIDKKAELFYLKIFVERLWEFKLSFFEKLRLVIPYINPNFIGWRIIPEIICSALYKKIS